MIQFLFDILGFAIAVISVLNLAKKIFSVTVLQVHLEMFFSKIRQRFGHNNNPNVIEFRSAMKHFFE